MYIPPKLKWFSRSLVYPGLDLHTRNRASLCRFWKQGSRDVLDAGSGNGYFAWLAYRSGARVVAKNFEAEQVERAREFFFDFRKLDPGRLCFEQGNLYDLADETRRFDEIICYETLEHICRDDAVVKEFFRILRPNGVLHLCCPHRLHPRHQAEVLDEAESGGHVRRGYTEEDYRNLLEPIGFQIERVVGIGTPLICMADTILRTVRSRIGDIAALPLLGPALPSVWLARANPRLPFSLYVQATKLS